VASTVIPTVKELEGAFSLVLRKGKTKVAVERNIYIKLFGCWYIIPKGLLSDGASIPWLLTFLVKRFDVRILLFSVLHDYFYTTQFLPRSLADCIYREGLNLTANRFIASVFYYVLRLAGWVTWRLKTTVTFPKAMVDRYQFLCKNSKNI